MADFIYTNATKLLGDGTVDWDAGGHTYTLMLLLAAHVPDRDADVFVADIVADEISVAGYARVNLTTRTVTVDNANNRSDYDADNPVWVTLAAGQTIGFAAIFKLVTNDADSPLIALLDPADLPTNGGQVTLRFNATAGSGTAFRIAAP